MKRVRAAIGVAFVVLVGVIGCHTGPAEPRSSKPQPGESEPSYKGRTLSSWLSDYDGSKTTRSFNAFFAILEIGTNGIPSLLELVGASEPGVSGQSQVESNRMGAHGFMVIGRDGQSAVPALIEIARGNPSYFSRRCAVLALGGIGPTAAEAVPLLVTLATNADFRLQAEALQSLNSVDFQTCTNIDRLVTDPVVRAAGTRRIHP